MQITSTLPWTYLTVNGHENDTSAVLRTPEFTLQITHKSADCTMLQVLTPDAPEGYDFQHRGPEKIEFGWHNTPRDAFRFADAYVARTEAFIPERGRQLSARYSAAVDAAYAQR